MYDIIGDIHGHAAVLKELLKRLGYNEVAGVYRHPERQVIFCGDFVDRGPAIRETLRICRAMCDAGTAQAIMGNHELNALAYATPHPDQPGDYLRARRSSHTRQHQATLDQLSPEELLSALDWFRTLPVSLDFGAFRVVHACWDTEALATIDRYAGELGYMSVPFLVGATTKGHPLGNAIERVMKGPEMRLPQGFVIVDKEGSKRKTCRIRWYLAEHGHTIGSYVMQEECDAALAEMPLPVDVKSAGYSADEPPLFIGHYWLGDEWPSPVTPNIVCVDYSVAKGGKLAAYRYDGERVLSAEKFVWVNCNEIASLDHG